MIGNMATVGGMDNVFDLCLFDSLYADFDQFDQFVQSHLPSFGVYYSDYRFSSIYTLDGGTYQNNLAMIERAKEWTESANRTDVMIVDNNGVANLTSQEVKTFSLIFKYTSLSHDDIPRNLFYEFLSWAP